MHIRHSVFVRIFLLLSWTRSIHNSRRSYKRKEKTGRLQFIALYAWMLNHANNNHLRLIVFAKTIQKKCQHILFRKKKNKIRIIISKQQFSDYCAVNVCYCARFKPSSNYIQACAHTLRHRHGDVCVREMFAILSIQ